MVSVVLGGLLIHLLVSFPLILRFLVGLSPFVFFSRVKVFTGYSGLAGS